MPERDLSPAEQQFFQNPYPAYQLARNTRLIFDEANQFWRVTNFQDVDDILKDPRFAKQPPPGTEANSPIRQVDRFNRGILNLDPPDHTRLRALMVKAFNARSMEAMRPGIGDLVEQLIEKVYEGGGMELKSEFAHPIPATIISDMLGIPKADRPRFANLSNDIIRYGNDLLQANDDKAEESVRQFDEYLGSLFAIKRQTPADDLTTALINARDEQGALTEEELHHNIRLLFIAGHETTVNLICNAVIAIAHHEAQRQRLIQDPSLMPSAVEEFLRYDSSVQQLPRVAQQDVEIDGQTIRGGQMVVLMLGSANHDPEIYTEAEQLDVTRSFTRSKSFGGGAHFCLGAQLARIETEIALNALLKRMPDFEVTYLDALEYPPNPFFRGPERLDVAWHPR